MRRFGLKTARCSQTARKCQDEGREPLSHPNILGQLCPITPNVVWASDFTFTSYNGASVCLCTVIGVFTGELTPRVHGPVRYIIR